MSLRLCGTHGQYRTRRPADHAIRGGANQQILHHAMAANTKGDKVDIIHFRISHKLFIGFTHQQVCVKGQPVHGVFWHHGFQFCIDHIVQILPELFPLI